MSIVLDNPVIQAHCRGCRGKVKKDGSPYKRTYFTLFYMCEVIKLENDGLDNIVISKEIRQEIRNKIKA